MSFLPTSFSVPHHRSSHIHIKTLTTRRRVGNEEAFIFHGLDLGTPLNLISTLFTELHYGENRMNLKLILLQFFIGYYSYGKDRYKDALEYEKNPTSISAQKESLYYSLLKRRYVYRLSYCFAFYAIFTILYCEHDPIHTLPILLLLYSSEYYKELKTYNATLKPFYVSFMWTFATVIMPCVLLDHNYDILYDVNAYIPCFLLLFASTNLADIKDIEEDKLNDIRTLPVQLGETNTMKLVFASLATSSALFGIHPHYLDHPWINSLFELQNAVLSLLVIYVKIQKTRN